MYVAVQLISTKNRLCSTECSNQSLLQHAKIAATESDQLLA